MDAKEIIGEIKNGIILPKNLVKGIDVEAYLDRRDGDKNFEKELVAAFESVQDIDSDQIENYSELHLYIFKHIEGLIGSSELSCYVAEDFEVILKVQQKGLSNSFVDNLLNEYMAGGLPNA